MQISLSAARKNAMLRQRDVAHALNVCSATVANWESGKTDISANDFMSLCSLYGVKAEDISLPCQSSLT